MKVVTTFQLALLSLLGKIIKVARCSGAVAEKVRQAGRKSPCQWQSRSDLCTKPPKFDEFTPICYNKYSKEILFETLDSSLVSLEIPWLQASERLAPCSQLVAKTKKTPFYGPLTSGFAVHCVYSGLSISHGNRPNVPKPTRKNNFMRVQLLSALLKPAQNRRFEPSVLHRAGHQSSRVIKCS